MLNTPLGAVRLQKLLAGAGVASRRMAERLIRDGRVAVDGRVVLEPGTVADPSRQRVTVDGQPLRPPEARQWVLLNKPVGYLTSRADSRGRPLVFELVPAALGRLHAVGRLDFDTEGLLLLTNDGELTYRLTHPRHGVPRVYHAWVEGAVDAGVLTRLRQGVLLDDGPGRVDHVRAGRRHGDGLVELTLVIHEGRNREVRRLCRAVGLGVRRLVRVAYGPLRLGRLPVGAWRHLGADEIQALRHTTGLGTGASAGPGPPPDPPCADPPAPLY